jgi:hypothetical protein
MENPAKTSYLLKSGEDPQGKDMKISPDLSQRKETSETMLHLAGKDHELTGNYKNQAETLYHFISKNIDPKLKSVAERLNTVAAKMRADAESADKMMREIADIKSQIDISINHYILNPLEKPDLNDLDKKISVMSETHHSLLSKNKMLLDFNHKLTAYENIIKRIHEIDLPATKIAVNEKRNEAKQFLLRVMQNPSSTEDLKKRMVDQYAKVDTNTAEIDKAMTEVMNAQNAIFITLEKQPDISTENLEANFRDIAEKTQALSAAVNQMNEGVLSLGKMSSA